MRKLLIAFIGILALLVMLAGCATGGAGGPRIDSITAEIVSAQTTEEATDTLAPQTPEGASVEISIIVSNFEAVDTIGETIAPTGNETAEPADGYFVYYMEMVPEEALMTTTPAEMPAATTKPVGPTGTIEPTSPMEPEDTATVVPEETVTPPATATPTSRPWRVPSGPRACGWRGQRTSWASWARPLPPPARRWWT